MLVIIWSPVTASELRSDAGLEFRRVVGDSHTHIPDASETVRIPSKTGTRAQYLYVERKPSFQIPPDDIRSVIIEKVNVVDGTPRRKDAGTVDLPRDTSESKAQQTEANRYRYQATVLLSQTMMRRFADFANNNDRQTYEISLGHKGLSIVDFVVPTGGFQDNSKVTFFLESTNLSELRVIFTPFGKKVVWK